MFASLCLIKEKFFSVPLIKTRTASLIKLLEAYRQEFLVGIANCKTFFIYPEWLIQKSCAIYRMLSLLFCYTWLFSPEFKVYVVPHRGRWAHVTRKGRGHLAQRKRKLGKEFDSRESRIKDKHDLMRKKFGSWDG